MSSTNRSNARDKHVSDYYQTPEWAIKDFLAAWLMDSLIDRPDKMFWLDPCAGGDKHNGMSYADIIRKEFDAEVLTIDIREDSKAEIKKDYLTFELTDKPDVIITNPPFNQAQQIIEKALDDVAEGGFVCMLLRLNFFGSQGRFKFWQRNMPRWCYVHSRRLSFIKGATDSVEYMHCVWEKGYKAQHTELKII